MKAPVGALAALTCMCAQLMISEFSSAVAQETHENEVVTARATSNAREDAYGASMNKVWYLCMLRGLNNISRIKSDCVQNDSPGGYAWECVGSAACKR
jgi:hypothetical protein